MALNFIWVAFFVIAFTVALIRLVFFHDIDIFEKLVKSTFDSSKEAFEISLSLTGAMTLWLGIMKIGERGGIIKVLTFIFAPFFQRLFPEIPKDHPAITAIFMKMSANFLGLDNAGTPIAIKAMREMQTLNPTPHIASNAQIMFTVLNTTGLTLIPITILAFRTIKGAENPSDIFIPVLLSTTVTGLTAMIITSLIQKIKIWDPVFLAYLLGILGFIGLGVYYFSTLPDEEISQVSSIISNFTLFFIIFAFIIMAMAKGENVYDAFIEGAKDGFDVAVKIIPYLVGIIVGIAVFRTSGAFDLLIKGVELCFDRMGITGEFIFALPVAFLKPLSGSGSQGMMLEIMETYSPDSLMGTLACVFQGTTDTTLFILAVYFGSVNIKQTRYAAAVGLFADVVGLTSAVFITYMFFF